MSYSSVRLALVGSVACTAPLVNFQMSQLSIVPKASSPAAARASSRCSRSSHSTLVPEKYASTTSPVFAVMLAACGASSAQRAAVRRSCQTIALATGRPDARSHTTVVSRWFVMPIASGVTPDIAIASRPASSTPVRMSIASCSTHPGCGKCCGSSR